MISVSPAAIRADVVVPAGEPWSGIIEKGEVLRIIDLEGQQAVDFICFNAKDTKETYDVTVTVRLTSRPPRRGRYQHYTRKK